MVWPFSYLVKKSREAGEAVITGSFGAGWPTTSNQKGLDKEVQDLLKVGLEIYNKITEDTSLIDFHDKNAVALWERSLKPVRTSLESANGLVSKEKFSLAIVRIDEARTKIAELIKENGDNFKVGKAVIDLKIWDDLFINFEEQAVALHNKRQKPS